MNAAVLEMQRKMWLKDETLKQLRAVVFDSETESEHRPHQKQQQESKWAAEDAPLQQKSDSSSTPHVGLQCTQFVPFFIIIIFCKFFQFIKVYKTLNIMFR